MPSTISHTNSLQLKGFFPSAIFYHADDIRVASVCERAQACRPGDLFVARQGADYDGHALAGTAVRRGAAALLVERLLPFPVPQCVVPDTAEALACLAHALAGNPSQQLTTLAVTGTSGKTVTSHLLASIWAAAEKQVGWFTSLGFHDGESSYPTAGEMPNAEQLAQGLWRMHLAGCEASVIELGCHAITRHEAAGLACDAAVITNLRGERLGVHGNVASARQATLRIANQLKSHGLLVMSADDRASAAVMRHLDRPLLTYSLHTQADVTGIILERTGSEQTWLLRAGCETIPVRTRIIGDHHVASCLAAAAVALARGFDLSQIARGLEAVTELPGRMQRIDCGQPFGVFVDEAQTPDRLAAALKSLKRVTRGRVLCVFGVDARQDPDWRPLVGRTVERLANVQIITSNNPRQTSPRAIAHDILDGYDRPSRAHLIPDRERAIQYALATAEEGDTVLIAGKGDRCIQIHGRKAEPFDDAALARNWLYDDARETPDAPHILPFPGVKSRR